MKESNLQQQMKINLKEKVKEQLDTLSTKTPSYEELSLKEKAIVEQYIEQVDLAKPETIDEFGTEETEEIYQGLNELMEKIKIHDTSLENMFVELMIKIDESIRFSKNTEKSFIQQFKESPIAALARFKSTNKKLNNIENKRKEALENIEIIKGKIEEIRDELRTNAKNLENMAQNSAQQYANIQYQIIALEELRKRIIEKQKQVEQLQEKSFMQIDQLLQLSGAQEKITNKIEDCKNVGINVASKAIMARLLVQHNDECASKYDKDLLTVLPKLTETVIISEVNDSLIQDVEIYNTFINTVNEKMSAKNTRSKEENKNIIDVETKKVVTSNV